MSPTKKKAAKKVPARGRPPDGATKRTERITLRFEPDDHARLVEAATKDRTTLSAALRRAALQWADRVLK